MIVTDITSLFEEINLFKNTMQTTSDVKTNSNMRTHKVQLQDEEEHQQIRLRKTHSNFARISTLVEDIILPINTSTNKYTTLEARSIDSPTLSSRDTPAKTLLRYLL
ncbi:hypothetical protein Slin14017_G128510 [Septoria linicola]|nr:hypothetical protein Slin14017_G128510 [Septoria linicola]